MLAVPEGRRGEIIAVCIRGQRGIPKVPQLLGTLVADHGLAGDRHAGSRTRQVSLLDEALLQELAALGMPVAPGVLGENLTVRGLSFAALRPGDRLRAGEQALLEVVEPRVPCRTLTPIDPRLPEVIVGRAGLLCRVLTGGPVAPADIIEVANDP